MWWWLWAWRFLLFFVEMYDHAWKQDYARIILKQNCNSYGIACQYFNLLSLGGDDYLLPCSENNSITNHYLGGFGGGFKVKGKKRAYNRHFSWSIIVLLINHFNQFNYCIAFSYYYKKVLRMSTCFDIQMIQILYWPKSMRKKLSPTLRIIQRQVLKRVLWWFVEI